MTQIVETEDRQTDSLTVQYDKLTERLEDLTSEDLESIIQTHDRLETVSQYLSCLSVPLSDLEDLETLETSIIQKRLSEIDSSVSGLTDDISDLMGLEMISFLVLSESVREYFMIDPDCNALETLTEGQTDCQDLRETVSGLTEDLETLLSCLRVSRQSLEDILEDLEIISDNLETVSDNLKTLRQEIDLRHERIEIRVKIYTDLETGQVISDQLKENTGRSLLDSGDFYGRNYDRNKTRDFESEDRISVDIGSWGLTVSIETFSFMRDCLDFDSILQSLYLEYNSLKPESRYWSQVTSEFIEDLESVSSVTGIYGEGQTFSVNTYNHESLLSQVIQFDFLTLENIGSLVILQTHNGCDVRGGYARPIVYTLSDYDQAGILRDSDMSLCIETDSGSHIYGYIQDGYNITFDSDDLESLCPRYDWRSRSDNLKRRQRIENLKFDLERHERIICEFAIYGDPESESDRERLDSLLRIRDKKTETLEDLESDSRSWRSLSFDSFVCIDRDDLLTMTPEEIVSEHCQSDEPKIIYWTDKDTQETCLRLSGIGRLYFDYYID